MCVRVLLVLLACGVQRMAAEPVRLSIWYWLNSTVKTNWDRDFRDMKEFGFTDAVLCWGLDASAFALRQQDTLDAMRLAGKHGLGAFLVVWHPTHNTLARKPEFLQVDAAGNVLFSFNVFDPEWRESGWRSYLETIASVFGKEPNMSGYMFDDSFGFGGGGGYPSGGVREKTENRIISYNPRDARRFGATPPRKATEPRWREWMEARARWWEDWARETVSAIRSKDPNPKHIVYLEDEEYILRPDAQMRTGVHLGRVAKHFDAVSAYAMNVWNSPADSAQIGPRIREILAKTRTAAGREKVRTYTFWITSSRGVTEPGPPTYPTVDQIKILCETLLSEGVRWLDMYGYRIGDWRLRSVRDWESRRPGSGRTYPLTGELPPGKYLVDRAEIRPALRDYLLSLRSRN